MARTSARVPPDRERVLRPACQRCLVCGSRMRIRYENRRTLVTLTGSVRLRLKIRRCETVGCPRLHRPDRPEAEGALALPQHEFGLDVMALVGALRHRDHRSVPEIHAALTARGVTMAERSVTNLLDRYDELLATTLMDRQPLQTRLAEQGRVILALDGLQPDVGHEVLWVIRDCLSGIGRPRSAKQWPRRCRGCRISSATFMSCARRLTRSSRRTGMPRRNSGSRCAGSAGSSEPWRNTPMPRRLLCRAIARRCVAPSPMMAVRPWRPRA